MADFLGALHHYFGSRNLYDALGVANDATGYLFSKHISNEKCRRLSDQIESDVI